MVCAVSPAGVIAARHARKQCAAGLTEGSGRARRPAHQSRRGDQRVVLPTEVVGAEPGAAGGGVTEAVAAAFSAASMRSPVQTT